METTLDELCKGHPPEFKEYMEYCRKLEFTAEPNYKYLIGLFEQCMQKNQYDPKVLDFAWKTKSREREIMELKKSVMKVITKKKPDEEKKDSNAAPTPGGK